VESNCIVQAVGIRCFGKPCLVGKNCGKAKSRLLEPLCFVVEEDLLRMP